MMNAFEQSKHITILSDYLATHGDRSRDDHPSNPPTRWVLIADKAFCVTPQTRYRKLLSDGKDYYPYYDNTLTTIDNPDDLDHITQRYYV